MTSEDKESVSDTDEICEIEPDYSSIRPICKADFMEPYDLFLKIHNRENYLIIDVRSKTDFQNSKINGKTVNIPPEDFEKKMSIIIKERLYDVNVDMVSYSLLANWHKCGLIILVDWEPSWTRLNRDTGIFRNTLMRQEPYNGRPVSHPRVMILQGGFLEFAKKYPYMIKTPSMETPIIEHKPPTPPPMRSKKLKTSSSSSTDRFDDSSSPSYKTAVETLDKSLLKVEIQNQRDCFDLRAAITSLLAIADIPSYIRSVLHCINNTPNIDRAVIVLKNLTSTIDRYDKDGPYEPHIFLRMFLKSMHYDLMKEPEKTSPISDLFFGTMKGTFICMTCKNSSTKYEEFQTLTVPRNKNIWTEGFGLVDFISELMQERSVGFNCPKCNVPRKAIKRFGFSRLPPNIVINVERLITFEKQINRIRVNFPFSRLNLDHYMSADAESSTGGLTYNYCYNLYAMICVVETRNGKEYVAYYKNPRDQRWSFYGNNNEVRAFSKEVKKQKFDNHLLFYRRELRR